MDPTFSALADQAATGSPDIPETWKQGRTAYGGLSAALLLARVRGEHDELPPLRSALVNFTGPVADAPDMTTELLRRGRNVTTVQARADLGGRAACTAVFSFGGARDSHVRVDRPAPGTPPPDRCEPFTKTESPFIPAFLRNYDVKLIEGTRPIEGGTRGYLRCWARHSDPAARSGEIALLGLADILPPATFPIMTQMGPVSSMSWICNILRDTDTTDGWYMVESELSAAHDGYCSQVMRIWNRDGALIVDGMQSIAVFV
ncbi:thioesterase family protein [uncultured Algimonas sp.]|uniref:acyl-CoA thioesterase n=1 Tax=uncultured Algimonas sp. TaxID=1547920 RepID=UPI002623CDDF|nr:thioesterase family protein [uncultured Algimonas sp.]